MNRKTEEQNMPTIKDLTVPRSETLEGNVQGIIDLRNVLSKRDEFEKDADRVFQATYLTQAMKHTIQRVSENLARTDQKRGTFLLNGGYGTGKSHQLLTLYHLFNSPKQGQLWLQKWNVRSVLPQANEVILLPLHSLNPTYLWEPIFDHLCYTGFDTTSTFPTHKHIAEAIEAKTVFIILDELERWYTPISDNYRRNANLTFLQNLAEMSNDNSHQLFVFVSLLGFAPDVKAILDRVHPFQDDLTIAPDRKDIVIYRLFSEVDKDGAKDIVEAYLDLYKQLNVNISDFERYREQMFKYYPFHPELLDLLLTRYASSRNYNNTRGVLHLLSHIIQEHYDKTDLLCAGHANISNFVIRGELSELNAQLVRNCYLNWEESEGIPNAEPVMSAILLYSLGEVKNAGATTDELILSAMKPGDNINDLDDTINQLFTSAEHLHSEGDRYLFKEEENVYTLIDKRAKNVREEKAVEKIIEVIKSDVFGSTLAYVHPYDEIPDNKDIKYVIAVERLDENDIVEGLYKGREYPNSLIVVEPKVSERITENADIVTRSRRIIAADSVIGEVAQERKNQVKELKETDTKSLKAAINDRYGRWKKWAQLDQSVRLINANITLDKKSVDKEIANSYDKVSFKSAVIKLVENSNDQLIVKALGVQFLKQRGFPIFHSEDLLKDSILDLCQEEKVVLDAGQGKIYYGSKLPNFLDDSTLVKRAIPQNIPTEEETPPDKPSTEEKGGTGGTKIKEGGPDEPTLITTTIETVQTAIFSNIGGLIDQLEKTVATTSTIRGVTIKMSALMKGNKIKADYQKLIGKIPVSAEDNLKVAVELQLNGSYTQNELLQNLNKLPNIPSGEIQAIVKVERNVS